MIAIQQIVKIESARQIPRFENPLPDTVSAGLEEGMLPVRPLPADKRWETFLHGLSAFSADFMAGGRDQGVQPEREAL